jgi:UDP-N-acetylglucosamine 3-dehydrogenase
MRVAVIGVGSMGRNHARVYRELKGASLVAVADADEKAARRCAEANGTRCYQNHRQLLEASRPEAVSVAVPTEAHFEIVMDALSAGCHVLVEKPIAGIVEQAEEMVREARRRNLVLTVGHIERFNPAVLELKRRLAAGALGDMIYQIHTRRIGPFPARISDVGVVIDLATHDLDVMRWLVGSRVSSVYAETRQNILTGREDLLVGVIRFENDVVGMLETNWITPTKVRELAITGERGMFRADYLTQDLFFFENSVVPERSWDPIGLLRGGVDEGSMTRFALHRREPLAAQLEAFLAASSGERAPVVSGDDGVAALRLAWGLINSAASHNPVSLAPT